MDGSRFDRLARELANGHSRRDLFRVAGAAALGALGLAGAGRGVEADDQCKPAAPLPQSKCTKDAQCCAGLVCQAASASATRSCQPGCRIDGTFYASGATDPANPCRSCEPGTSTTAWTNEANGTACDDGEPGVCQEGACVCRPLAADCAWWGECCRDEPTDCAPSGTNIGELQGRRCCRPVGGVGCTSALGCCAVNAGSGTFPTNCSPAGVCGGPGAACSSGVSCVSGNCIAFTCQ